MVFWNVGERVGRDPINFFAVLFHRLLKGGFIMLHLDLIKRSRLVQCCKWAKNGFWLADTFAIIITQKIVNRVLFIYFVIFVE